MNEKNIIIYFQTSIQSVIDWDWDLFFSLGLGKVQKWVWPGLSLPGSADAADKHINKGWVARTSSGTDNQQEPIGSDLWRP